MPRFAPAGPPPSSLRMARVRKITIAALAVALAAIALGVAAPWNAAADGGSRSAYGNGGDRTALASGGFARRLLRLQNSERRRRGLSHLSVSSSLDRAARRHARDMVRSHYFGHVSHGGGTVVNRVASTPYGRAGRFAASENLFWWSVPRSASAVVNAWMGSAVHRANVLGSFRHFGIAVVMRSPYGRGGVTVVGVYARHIGR